MPEFTLNEKLITAIKSSLPEGENMAQVLMDILLIGRESVYRRLRGEVYFTFEEISKISKELEFSIDSVVGINNSERAIFDFNLLNPQSKMEDYSAKLESYIRLYRQMKKHENSRARYALNNLPYTFYLSYFNIARFKYYKWLYQANTAMPHLSFSELQIPSNIMDLQKSFVAETRYIKRTLVILDRNVFSSMVYDIEYFYKLNIITMSDVEMLKEELLEMLDDLEGQAISGLYKTGTEVQMYLSNVDIEATYCHYEYGDHQYSHLRLYSINGIDSQVPKVCTRQKEWIDSLKRYSTLITQSGEMQRVNYFNRQRDLIKGVCSNSSYEKDLEFQSIK